MRDSPFPARCAYYSWRLEKAKQTKEKQEKRCGENWNTHTHTHTQTNKSEVILQHSSVVIFKTLLINQRRFFGIRL